jgi:glycerol uptake facilitator-like aquaporin
MSAVGIVVVAVFFLAGLRYVPPILTTYSPGLCGPRTDAAGNPAGDYGPCPSHEPLPMPRDGQWEWSPFWVTTD